MDVQNFRPGEISVSAKGKFMVIEGNHQVHQNGLSFTSRHFENRYLFPDNALPEILTYSLDPEGILEVRVARDDSIKDFMGAEHAA